MPKDVLKKYPSGITIQDAIILYKKMLDDPKYKSVTIHSAAYKRMKELQVLYNAGLRNFPRKKKGI